MTPVLIVALGASGLFAIAATPASAAALVTAGTVVKTDGTPTFDATAGPGNDTGANNGIVRTLDIVTYEVTVGNDGGGNDIGNTTVVATLPSGMAWAGLEGVCRVAGADPEPVPPSTISADRRTLTCNIGDRLAGSLVKIPLRAFPLTTVPDGTLKTANFRVEYDDSGRQTLSAGSRTIRVSAGKPVDLSYSDDSPTVGGQHYSPATWELAVGRSDLDGTVSNNGSPIVGAIVGVFDNSGAPILDPITGVPMTATTDASGHYQFLDVVSPLPGAPVGGGYIAGAVTVRVLSGAPSGQQLIPTSEYVLTAQGQPLTADFAYVAPTAPGAGNATISGSLFTDRDADGVDDGSGEEPIDGVTVTLTGYDLSGMPVSMTVDTDANGNYSFNVPPSDANGYHIEFTGRKVAYYLPVVSNEYTLVVASGETRALNVGWNPDRYLGRGYVTAWPFAINAGITGKGVSAPAGTVGWDAAVPAGTELYTWADNWIPACGDLNYYFNLDPMPGSKSTYSYGAERNTPNSGTYSCDQTAAGQPITMSDAGANMSGITIPTRSVSGTTLPITTKPLITGYVAVFTPDPGCNALPPVSTIVASNLTGTDLSGHPLVDAAADTNDNSVALNTRQCYDPPGETGGLKMNKQFTTAETVGWKPLPNLPENPASYGFPYYFGSSQYNLVNSNSNQIAPTTLPFSSILDVWNENGIYDFYNTVACDKYDNTRFRPWLRTGVTPSTPLSVSLVNPTTPFENRALVQYTSLAAYNAASATSGAYIIEFGVRSSYPNLGTQDDIDCNDPSFTWTTWDPAVAVTQSFLDTTVAVRVRAKAIEPGDHIIIHTEMKRVASPATSMYAGEYVYPAGGPTPSPDNTLANSASARAYTASGDIIDQCNRWSTINPVGGNPDYYCDLTRFAEPATGIVRIAKYDKNAGPNAPISGRGAGELVTFQMDMTANSVFPSGTNYLGDVHVVDTLPAGLTYVPDSGSITPESVITDAAGVTTITWVLGDLLADAAATSITYKARVADDIPNDTVLTNTAVISSPDDPSPVALRTDIQQIQVATPAELKLFKTTPDAFTEPGDSFRYELNYRNLSNGDIFPTQDFIDTLPYNTDPRGNVFGDETLVFDPAIANPIEPEYPDDEIYVTLTRPTSADPRDASNALDGTGTTGWCEVNLTADDPNVPNVGTAGCPLDVHDPAIVAVRVRSTHPLADTDPTRTITLYMTTSTGNVGEVTDSFINSFSGYAEGLATYVSSNRVSVTIRQGRIGNYVWTDSNGNGIQDAGEAGINGVTVKLTGTSYTWDGTQYVGTPVTLSTVTANNPSGGQPGWYEFPNLNHGSYRLQFPASLDASSGLPGFTLTTPDNGSDLADSDADTAGFTPWICLGEAPHSGTIATVDPHCPSFVGLSTDQTQWDAGYLGVSNVGDFVWNDTNGNGVQDGGETGLANAIVRLLAPGPDGQYGTGDETVITSVTTGANGLYNFPNLVAGQYEIEIVPPAGYISTYLNSTTDSIDSDLNRASHRMLVFAEPTSLYDNQSVNRSYDAGFVQAVSFGDVVFADANANGIQDAGELANAAMNGIKVELLNALGSPMLDANGRAIFTYTAQNGATAGYYHFDDLMPGTYQVRVTAPFGYTPSPQTGGTGTSGTGTATDSDATRAGIATITLASGDPVNNNLDFGLFRPSAIGDHVWIDIDNDGVQDATELGLAGVTVRLLDQDGAAVLNSDGVPYVVTTDVAGNYLFENLLPRPWSANTDPSYRVEFVLPSGYRWSGTSAIDPIDYRYTPLSGSATTDSDAGWDSRSQATAQSGQIWTSQSETNDTIDAGVYVPAKIGNYVWIDLDGDGAQGLDETGLASVTVTLWKSDGSGGYVPAIDDSGVAVGSQTTGSSGAYSFTNLAPGDYVVRFTLGAAQAYTSSPLDATLDTIDSDITHTTAREYQSAMVSVIYGANNTTIDAGFVPTVSLGNRVWTDTDADGIQDAGEVGLANTAVTLWTAGTDGAFGTADDVQVTADVYGTTFGTAGVITTDGTGNYTFANLPANTYQVRFDPPAGVYLSPQNNPDDALVAGNDSDASSTIVGGAYLSTPVTLDIADVTTRVDAGFWSPAGIGDIVWEDTNGNGTYDAGESGLAGAQVSLWKRNPDNTFSQVLVDIDGNHFAGDLDGAAYDGIITTDATGAYSFSNLEPGVYQVRVTTPTGFVLTGSNVGANDNIDSDVVRTTASTGSTANITLASGQVNNTVDIGAYEPASIGDIIFDDADGDGIQDPGEGGVVGATVTLVDAAGNPVTTDAYGNTIEPIITLVDGAYSFTNLVPGTYRILVDLPDGRVFSAIDQGSGATADEFDSDVVVTTGLTASITLNSGDANDTVDAGSYEVIDIGSHVWEDADADGIFDSGESGISGATVELLDANGDPVASTSTDATGKYSFTRFGSDQTSTTATMLTPGTYSVRFTRPAGYAPTVESADGARDINGDSDAIFATQTATTGTSAQFTVAQGESAQEIDAGFYRPATLGNFVFQDTNGNGLLTGDSGVVGATVTLVDGNGDPVLTDAWGNTINPIVTVAGGAYSFPNLTPGTYGVEITPPAGWNITYPNVGTDNAVDSDLQMNGLSDTVTLVTNETNNTLDAGLYQPATIGNFVFEDTNGNGTLDASELGITGAIVTLWIRNSDGTYTQITAEADGDPFVGAAADGSITTTSSGAYSFTGLRPADYQVRVTMPDGYVLTASNTGANDAIDSDVVRDTGEAAIGRTADINLISNETDNTVDIGGYEPAAISDLVFNDANGNGIQDSGETGLANVTVTLLDASGNPVTTDAYGNTIEPFTTLADGLYSFGDLVPGTYIIAMSTPSGYTYSAVDEAATGDATPDAHDSDINALTGRSPATQLSSGETDNTVDGGLFEILSIGSLVWEDLNANGIVDTDEPGIADVFVELLDADGQPVASTTTDADGNYTFDRFGDDQTDNTAAFLTPGTYSVRFTRPTDYAPTMLSEDAPRTTDYDSDAKFTTQNAATGTTAAFVIGQGETEPNIDAGFFVPATLSNLVFEDINGDGLQQAGEGGVANVIVTLVDADGNPVTTDAWGNTISPITTLADGLYSFPNLTPGTYGVKITRPTGWLVTYPNEGTNDARDSDLLSTGLSDTVTLVSQDDNADLDIGLYRPASIGDLVWNDTNGNGIKDTTEVGIASVPVHLQGTDGAGNNVDIVVLTAFDGSYSFTDLRPGTYNITVEPTSTWIASHQDQGTNDAVDSDIDPLTMATIDTVLVSGENDTTWDAALIATPAISGHVWNDLDGDGIRETGEPGIGGVTITLTGFDSLGNAVLVTAVTDDNGYYVFNGLPISDSLGYTITEGATPGYGDGVDVLGTAGGMLGNDLIGGIVVSSTTSAMNYDFSEILTSSISGVVYQDNTNDGIAQVGEPRIAGVTVTLDGLNDLNEIVHVETTTLADGSYTFSGLRPGTYTVTETQPVDYADSTDTAGTAGGTTTVNDTIADIVLGANTAATANNFGERSLTPVAYTSIDGTVWLDPNRNGAHDGGELTGLDGITITLYAADGVTVIATTTTDANGHYAFVGIPTGNYIVVQTQPEGYLSTSDDAYGTVALPLSVPAGGVRNIDFFEDLGRISGNVYVDASNDGIQDATEAGISGVQIRLDGTDMNGDPVHLVTTTDASGSYTFSGLLPGVYTVTETQPAIYADGIDTEGTVNALPMGSAADDIIVGIELGTGDVGTNFNFGEILETAPDTTWLAGHVFVDADGDGVLDAGESGLGGVTVTLYSADGLTVVATTTTGIDGGYLFTGIEPGNYLVVETQPSGFTSTSPDELGTVATPLTVPLTGLGNQNFGEQLPGAGSGAGTLSGTVWTDTDRDGVIDPGELGEEGVTITLLGANGNVVATTVTGVGGTYTFTNLVPGTYSVVESQPNGYGSSTPNTISDIVVTLAGVTDVNFGDTLSTVSGNVYVDSDNDGVFDSSETGIGGVTVTLTGFDINDNPVSMTTITSADGSYSFDGLLAGAYSITESQPVGHADGIDTAGSAGGDLSINDVIGWITVNPATDAVDNNFGEAPKTIVTAPGTVWISGVAYVDDNRDGTIDPSDAPLAGVVLDIFDASGTLVGTVVTEADGSYVITGLTPGADYTISEHQPVGYGSSQNGVSIALTAPATPGTGATGYDFGETTSSLSGVVYTDRNNDGVMGATEVGISGVVITLTGTDANGNPVSATTVTGADGTYTFDGLLSGTYTIVETQPAGWVDGVETTGTITSNLSTNDTQGSIILPVATDATDYLFGERRNAALTTSITGTVFQDRGTDGATQDGVFQPSEPGIGGVTLVLRDADGNIVATTVTGSDGSYRFDGVVPGEYTIEELQPAGYGSSTPNLISAINVPIEGVNSVNFGDTLGALVGTVYVDINGNGQQDADEPGIEGATLTLTGTDAAGNPVEVTVVTDADGRYVFADLQASDPDGYTIAETQPEGYVDGRDDSSQNGTIGNDVLTHVVLTPGDSLESGYFGEVVLTSIGDHVWDDIDGDGIQDADEPGIAGITVILDGVDDLGNTVHRTVTTDANGDFVFTDVRPGEYHITVVAPGRNGTIAGAGTDPNVDSNVGSTKTSSTFIVRSNRTPTSHDADLTNVDAGLYTPASVLGVAFIDQNGNGIRDEGEPIDTCGEIELVGAGRDGVFGTADDTHQTVIVNSDGTYRIDNVAPGIYMVRGCSSEGLPFTVRSGAIIRNADLPMVANQLAFTGSSALARTIYAFTLISGGVLLLQGSRRRRRLQTTRK